MNIRKDEVIKRLCALGTHVAERVYENQRPSNCFCGENPLTKDIPSFQYSDKVLDFIRDAVYEKIERMKS